MQTKDSIFAAKKRSKAANRARYTLGSYIVTWNVIQSGYDILHVGIVPTAGQILKIFPCLTGILWCACTWDGVGASWDNPILLT